MTPSIFTIITRFRGCEKLLVSLAYLKLSTLEFYGSNRTCLFVALHFRKSSTLQRPKQI